ncbi:MAG: flagellar biosynthetic protein FliO [Oscillospiraceae bacterium]
MDKQLLYSTTVMLMMIALIILAYIAFRYLRGSGINMGQSKVVKIVDRQFIAQDKMIASIIVKNKLVVVAFSSHSIEKLAEFDLDDKEAKQLIGGEKESFKAIFNAKKGEQKDAT